MFRVRLFFVSKKNVVFFDIFRFVFIMWIRDFILLLCEMKRFIRIVSLFVLMFLEIITPISYAVMEEKVDELEELEEA